MLVKKRKVVYFLIPSEQMNKRKKLQLKRIQFKIKMIGFLLIKQIITCLTNHPRMLILIKYLNRTKLKQQLANPVNLMLKYFNEYSKGNSELSNILKLNYSEIESHSIQPHTMLRRFPEIVSSYYI